MMMELVPDAVPVPSGAVLLPQGVQLLPDAQHDGFFYARLTRSSDA